MRYLDLHTKALTPIVEKAPPPGGPLRFVEKGELNFVIVGDFGAERTANTRSRKSIAPAADFLAEAFEKTTGRRPDVLDARKDAARIEAAKLWLLVGDSSYARDAAGLDGRKDSDKSVRRLMESMMREYNEEKEGALEILRCRLVELIILTVRKITADGKKSKNSAVMSALEYAEKNFSKNISLSDAAKKIGISPQYLSASFKNSTGMTFTCYVQKLRIGQSCRLLSFSDKKIIEIAELSGYNDIKFFNKIFKKHMNITPREFRKGIKEPKN